MQPLTYFILPKISPGEREGAGSPLAPVGLCQQFEIVKKKDA